MSQNTDYIIIDENSMLSCELLEKMMETINDRQLEHIKLILVGDII